MLRALRVVATSPDSRDKAAAMTSLFVVKKYLPENLAESIFPPADRVPQLMGDLFRWVKTTKEHPLIHSCVFHYEFEFFHPFVDGNGRMVKTYINALKLAGLIVRVGSNKTGYWKVNI